MSLRGLLISVGPFLGLAVAQLAFAYGWLDSKPPKQEAERSNIQLVRKKLHHQSA